MHNTEGQFIIYPEYSRIPPAVDTFGLTIEAAADGYLPAEIRLSVLHLNDCILEETIHIGESCRTVSHTISLAGLPLLPDSMGLGIEAASDTWTASTAVDRGNGPVRYGFVSDFTPEDRGRTGEAEKFLLRNHITHVQFYDWAYRPNQFGPGDGCSRYEDTMGKSIDLTVVKELIGSFRRRGMQSLAYGAVYAATADYIREHPEQALYDIMGQGFDLIGKFFIMNLNSRAWRDQILAQYRYAVETVGFDGIHMDTYGYPKSGWGFGEQAARSLEPDFISFIDEWTRHGDVNIFNNVGGWPAVSTAEADQTACYIELWDPYTRYRHIRELICGVGNSGKPVVFAAYLLPFKHRDEQKLAEGRSPLQSALLLTAAVSSLGATSLLLGEDGVILTQPYYSDYSRLSAEEQEQIRLYYDHQVRYRELFYDPDAIDITGSHVVGADREFSIAAGECRVTIDGEPGSLWVMAKRTDKRIVLNLVNLLDQEDDLWNQEKRPCVSRPEVTIGIPRYSDRMSVWYTEAGHTNSRMIPLETSACQGVRGPSISCTLPSVDLWTTIVCEL